LAGMTQRSAVKIEPIPLIMTQTSGSLITNISGRNIVTGVGKLRYKGHLFYRIYLSQGEGTFIHLAVQESAPLKILECRLYQPYHEIIPIYACTAEEAAAMETSPPAELIAPVGTDFDQIWSFWLKDDSDPNVGGMLGCPMMPGKNPEIDEITGEFKIPLDQNPGIDPATSQPWLYTRTWVPSNQRIMPTISIETVVDVDGGAAMVNHQMMAYARKLGTTEFFEYMLVSVSQTDAGHAEASVNFWLGMEIDAAHLTIYPAS
jgi:hypothetical protein